MRHRQIALPACVARIGLGQPFGDGKRGAVARQRGGQIALGNLHVADLVVRHRQIALPACVARIGLGQPFGDGKRGAVARQRGGQIALGNLHVADGI